MKVAFLVDSPVSNATEACGVGDYTFRVSHYLDALSVESRVFSRSEWNARGTLGLLRQIREYCADILHIQYPTIGYLRAFVTPGIAFLSPAPHVILTAHEFVQAHPLRKIVLGFLGRRSARIIFPSQYEREAFLEVYPGQAAKSIVVPIGSNIDIPTDQHTFIREPDAVVYFGQLRPKKGLDEFIRLAELAQAEKRSFRFIIVGTPHPRYPDFYKPLQKRASNLPITWHLGYPPQKVNEILARCTYAYLPFPDGASERRGSLLAVLSRGLVTITTAGPQTTESMKKFLTFADNPESALEQLELLTIEPMVRSAKSDDGTAFASSFSWEKIAESHYRIYSEVMQGAI